MINVFEPHVGEEELSALAGVFSTNWLGAGPKLAEFLRQLATHLGVQEEQVQSISSCTEGLFQAVAALDLAPEDEVIIPTVSFIGAANAVLAQRGRPVLCDVDPHTLNPTVEHVAAALTPHTRAVIVLHFGGHPGEIQAIANLARKHSLILIEDAACAIGSSVGGLRCGTFGDIGLWSFDAMKILVTGDGGAVWTRDSDVGRRIAYSTFLGIDATGINKATGLGNWWEVDPVLPGRRARMNDISAAIGLVQLGRLSTFLHRRHEIATIYTEMLAGLGWLRLPPSPPPGSITSWYFYWVQAEPLVRDTLAHYLKELGIYTTFRYWPLHRTKLCREGSRVFPGADWATDRTLLLPIHNGMSDCDVERVINALRHFPAK